MRLSEALSILAGLALGAGLGWLLERSRFSLCRVLRPGAHRTDGEMVNAFSLALALCWLVLGLVSLGPWNGLIESPSAGLLACLLGGFAAGTACGLVRACPLLFALRAGLTPVALAAFLAWSAGVVLGSHGPLAPLFDRLRMAGPGDVRLAALLGLPQWLILPALGAGLMLVLLKAPVRVRIGFMDWPKQGVGLAALLLLGWALAVHAGDLAGLNAVRAVEDVWDGVTGGPFSFSPSLLAGVGLIGFGLGKALKGPGIFRSAGAPVSEFAILVLGGVLLGLGSSLAAGDPAARGLFGLSVLSLGSLLFVLAFASGSWVTGAVEPALAGKLTRR